MEQLTSLPNRNEHLLDPADSKPDGTDEMMELDHALRYLGNFGRYQTLLYWLLAIISGFFPALQLMGMVFISYTPKPYYCTPPEGYYVNETVPVFLDKGEEKYDSCHMFVVHDGEVTENVTGCQFGWDFETIRGEQSVVTDYNLVCDDAILAKIAQSLFMTGVLVSSVTTGQLADIFGRKPILFISLIGEALSGLCMALVWNYYAFVFFWFLLGVFEQGLMNCSFVMIMEMFAPEKRTLAGSLCNVVWGISVVFVSPLAYGLRNWRYYEMLASLTILLVLPAWWFIPESARWLVSRGRIDEAEQILTKIADFNNIPVPTPSFLTSRPLELHEEVVPLRTPHKHSDKDAIYKPVPAPRKHLGAIRHGPKGHGFSGHQSSTKIAHKHDKHVKYMPTEQPEAAQSTKRHSILDILKSRVLLLNFLIIGYCWFVSSTVYYGLSLYSSELAGNVYFNVFLLCLVELPAFLVGYCMLRWIGRRISSSICLVVAGVSCVLTACLPNETNDGTDISALRITLATIGKFSISTTFAMIYVYAPELFPTDMRNVGLGACSFFARIGGIIAPFVLHLSKFSDYLPLNIFGIVTIVAGTLSLFLPETRNKPLPESIQDCNRQGHSSLCSSRGGRQRFESFNSQASDKANPAAV
ncbi:solute carrier family 22 member 15-like [Amphiura filiformis]|uniref:solute carrier family 22 member 15-like n=1 Tax=Amphiura filiformis TaxID=82378 RepID=UPI003B2247C7